MTLCAHCITIGSAATRSASPRDLGAYRYIILLAFFCHSGILASMQTHETNLDAIVRNMLEQRRGDWLSVAKESGVSRSWFTQFMAGKFPNPGIDTLRKIYAACCKPGVVNKKSMPVIRTKK